MRIPLITLGLTCLSAAASAITIEELQEQLQQQQKQIESLATALEQKSSTPNNAWYQKTSIGGYGEAYFKRINGSNDEFDAYRLVTLIGHQFSDRVRFNSELEIEHAYVKDTDTNGTSPKTTSGYLALEQLFLQYDITPKHKVNIGQVLVPIGVINEVHEPNTFNGVFRPIIEREIIPSTWFETGVQFSGSLPNSIRYDVLISSGLNNAKGNIKDGRQRGSKANGSDLAYTAKLTYQAMPGLELGGAFHQQDDMSQGSTPQDIKAQLWEVHSRYRFQQVGIKALYARWDIDNLAQADSASAKQKGWYIEPDWRINESFAVFSRLSRWDNKANQNSVDTRQREFNIGATWYLAPQAVLKADWQWRKDPTAKTVNQNGFNLGMGFSF